MEDGRRLKEETSHCKEEEDSQTISNKVSKGLLMKKEKLMVFVFFGTRVTVIILMTVNFCTKSPLSVTMVIGVTEKPFASFSMQTCSKPNQPLF